MSRVSIYVLLCVVMLCAWRPAYADTAAAFTEVYADNGLPDWGRPAPEGLHGLVGAAWFKGDRLVGDPRRRTILLPLVLLTWEDRAYWSVTGGGVWLYDSHHWPLRIGAGVKVHPGYDPAEDPDLVGMRKRRSSVDGYVNVLWKMELVNIGAAYYRDIGHVTRGDSATIRLSHHIRVTPQFTLTPRAGVEYQSARLVSYYYGVTQSEATPERPEYTGHHAVNYGAGASAMYRLNQSWSLLGGYFAAHLGNGISDSPILARRRTQVAFFGAGWTF